MTDKEAIDYFLQDILANIKIEYNKDFNKINCSEDEYIIKRLNEISKYICYL
jgi:hypothetical protein